MKAAVVDCGSRRCTQLCAWLTRTNVSVRRVPLEQAAERGLSDAQIVVVSGGPRLFTADPTLIDRFAFIDGLTCPTLGICLGHQAIGLRYGARVHRGPSRRGEELVELHGPHPLFAGVDARSTFDADHCEGISAPPGFRVLASSGRYAVEAMVHRHRPLFGVQFHPETSGPVGQRLLDNFIRLARPAHPPRTGT